MGRRRLRWTRKYHAPGEIVAVLVNLQQLPKSLDTVESMRIEGALDAKGPGLGDSVLSLSQAAQRGGQEERSGQPAAHRCHLPRERFMRNDIMTIRILIMSLWSETLWRRDNTRA